jgi:hypothetical protein
MTALDEALAKVQAEGRVFDVVRIELLPAEYLEWQREVAIIAYHEDSTAEDRHKVVPVTVVRERTGPMIVLQD